MKVHEEVLNWDYQRGKGGKEEPCDVQFYTSRASAWKTLCVKYYASEKNIPAYFEMLPGGEQLVTGDKVTINLYRTGRD